MNILFVNNFRGRGGGEEFLRDLLPGLVARGVGVGLICRPNTPLEDMFGNSSVVVYPIERSGLKGLPAVVRTAKAIRSGSYDIIAVQRGHDIIQAWIGSLLSGMHPKITYMVQVPEFIRSRFLLCRLDRIVTISRYVRDKIVAFAPDRERLISIIRYGIDISAFAAQAGAGLIRSRFTVREDAYLIGTVGDLWKNQIEFLDALVLIKKELGSVRFAIVASVGGTAADSAFTQRAEELGLSKDLVWVGRLSKEEMRSFYADLDVAVSTHRNEGFGIWVLEALARGTPVVAVNEGGIRDSLENCPAGKLVDGGPEAMAAEIVRVLRDDKLRTAMAEAGPRWVEEHFTKQRMIDEHYHFNKELLASG